MPIAKDLERDVQGQRTACTGLRAPVIRGSPGKGERRENFHLSSPRVNNLLGNDC